MNTEKNHLSCFFLMKTVVLDFTYKDFFIFFYVKMLKFRILHSKRNESHHLIYSIRQFWLKVLSDMNKGN